MGSPYPLQGSSCYWGCPTSSTPPLSPLSQHLTPPPHLYSWIEPQKGLEKAWPQSFGCSFFFLTLLQEFPFYLETFP